MILSPYDQLTITQTAVNLVKQGRNSLLEDNIRYYFWPDSATNGISLEDGQFHTFYAFELLNELKRTNSPSGNIGCVVGDENDPIHYLFIHDHMVPLDEHFYGDVESFIVENQLF